MAEKRIQVNFGSDVYGSFVLNRKRGQKIYKTQAIAERYIKKWLAKNRNHVCRCYDFANEKWFVWSQN